MLLYNNNWVICQQILQAGETWAISDGRPLASFCRFLSAVQITTSTRLTQSIYSPRCLILRMPFHSSLFQCCHCDRNLKMDELCTGKQRCKKKTKRRKGRGSDACLASATNVFLSLMLRQLSRSSFERYFYEVTSVFTAAALVTEDEYKEKSRRQGVWDRRHVLILRTASALSVTSLFSLAQKHALNLDREMLAFNIIQGLAPKWMVVELQICCKRRPRGFSDCI